jgi:hypothetical protein
MKLAVKYTTNTFAKLLLILVIIAFASCRKFESYPPVPQIKYEQGTFETVVDDLGNTNLIYIPIIYFTDGDGNIGSLVEGNIIVRPCDVENTHDFYVNLYEKIDGEFVKRDFEENYRCLDSSTGVKDSLAGDNLNLNVFLTYLEGRGQANSLVGEIKDRITVPSLLSDTVKFDFQLCDRENNYSNVVESPVFVIDFP